MRNILFTFGLAAMLAAVPVDTSAKKETPAQPEKQETSSRQTLEEATDSIKNILALAEKGDATAQNEVGMWYYRGRLVKQNYKTALDWWAKSAKQDNALAIGNMGLCYQTGNGIEADSLKATELYQISIKKGNKALLAQQSAEAKKGNVFSCMLVASCHQRGIGVAKSANNAIPFLTIAAEKGCTDAEKSLGLVLLNEDRATQAAPWFKKASEKGDLMSAFYCGKMLLEGLGVTQDKKEGANYMLKAAEGGFPQAMYYLGNCYINGDGLTKNAGQGVMWLSRAAGKGVSNAQWALAQCLRQGLGTPVDYDSALYWYARANAKGHTGAFKKLIADSLANTPFMAYLKGMKAYGNKDYDAAMKEFKIVEKAKISDGKVMEAAIQANPSYQKHNLKKGISILEKAAADSNAQAMYLLGALYEAGKGVTKDMRKAVEYTQKAADKGYAPAECALADMYFEGRGVEQSYEKAVALYAEADRQGQLTENAAKRYASCYADGKGGLEQNKEKAEEILKADYKNRISSLLALI